MKYTGTLLTSNEKLDKTEKYLFEEMKQKWIIRGIQFLPGIGFCDGAKLGCLPTCLAYTGFAKRFKTVNKGRKKRNKLFLNDRKQFNKLLIKELTSLSKKALKENAKLAIRPNVYSSINWDLPENHIAKNTSIFDYEFPIKIQYYDYTEKPLSYILKNQRKNYHLTASHKGNVTGSWEMLKNGISVAIVKSDYFMKNQLQYFPPTITKSHYDGDLNDLRALDKRASIVWLSEKQSKKALSY